MPAIKENKRYTYSDYVQWDDGERWELIDGVPYNMTSAPNTRHQILRGWIGTELFRYLDHQNKHVFIGLCDVVLSDVDVVQPDIFVVCDYKKITETNIQGAPDLIIEILSPSTNRHDRWDKKRLYEKYGVKEYIVVDMEGGYSEQYFLQKNGQFHGGTITNMDQPLELKTVGNLSLVLQEALDVPPFNQQKSSESEK